MPIVLLLAFLIVPRLHFGRSTNTPPPHPAARVANVNVSRAGDSQAEVSVAVDPRNPRLLIAAANDFELGANSWISKDGGATWAVDSPELIAGCIDGDPALAFDQRGRAYLAVLVRANCADSPERVFVARRRTIATPWARMTAPVAGGSAKIEDDKPALAVDRGARSPHRNRIYVAWARAVEVAPDDFVGSIVITHSDDGGRTWSKLSRVSPATQSAFSASLAIAPNGDVYIAWDDPGNQGIWIDRSHDGVHFGADSLVAAYLLTGGEQCDVLGMAIPAQPHRCVGPNPIVTIDTDEPMRVLVTYGSTDDIDDSQSVFLAAFDKTLRRMIIGRPDLQKGVRITPPEPRGSRADQFWPVSALDASTKLLWVCFYDTTGDRSRRTASYSCMVSRGRRRDRARSWLGPVRVADIASDETQPRARRFEYGDYQGLDVSRGVAHPIWTDSRRLREAREEIYAAVLTEADVLRATRRSSR